MVSISYPEPVVPDDAAVPEKVFRGIHYDVIGDVNAWYRDNNDRLWIRNGTNLYIRTRTDQGYQNGTGKTNITQDGILTFNLKRTDESGKVIAESELCSEAYYVDAEAPGTEFSISGSYENGLIYLAKDSSVVLNVMEDGKSGLKNTAYCLAECQPDGVPLLNPESMPWTSCQQYDSIQVENDGCYRLYVRTEDSVGNVAFSSSNVFCRDTRSPIVRIDGVGDHTANSGEVIISVSVEDQNYKSGSLTVNLKGVNHGNVPLVIQRSDEKNGASVSYMNIPENKSYDDVYELSVSAFDYSGNKAEQKMTFSVNRYGSVYDLSDTTKSFVNRHYRNKPEDIIFYERNIDYLKESEIYCRHDGTLTKLKPSQDYIVNRTGNDKSWKEYEYRIPGTFFQSEGAYELVLTSEDRAKNSSDTELQEKRVSFILDWTAPVCVMSGVEQEGIYEETEITACITPRDNYRLKKLRIYHDSELMQEVSDFDDREATIRVPINSSDAWQTLQVYVEDMSGNTFWTTEVPVFVGSGNIEVPVYKKIRASAEELETKKDSKEKTTAEKVPNKEAVNETEGEDFMKKRVAEKKTDELREQRGILVLAAGVLILVVTWVILRVALIRKRR